MANISVQRDELYTKVARRILPFLFAGYVMSQIDRANIGFAKLQFVGDLGITEAAFGLAAGMFSLGYILFEVPSNLMLQRIGVRLTLLRIMVAWGACTALLMFAQSATHMYALRFVLGLAEAGFFPGILLYITYWFPDDRRGRATTLFVTAVPVAGMIGGPLSGWIMDAFNNVHGLRGWQWVFMLEGLPAILVGVLSYFYLSDRPKDASWLTVAEKDAIAEDLALSQGGARESVSFGEVLRKPAVWLFTIIYLGYYFALTSIGIWWPTLLKSVGAGTTTTTGLLSGSISAVAAIGMILIGRSSDRMGERRWHVALCGLVGAAAFLSLSLVRNNLAATVIVMMIATTGIFTVLGLFWTIPSQVLRGRGAAGGIAVISSIGNLAGFFAPVLIGTIKDRTGSLYIGFDIVALLLVGAMVMLLVVVPKAPRKRVVDGTSSGNAVGASAEPQLYAEDFQPGQAFSGVERQINDDLFASFASMTGDAHPIHYDDAFAAKTKYGKRLAHGLLVSSMTALGATPMSRRVERAMVAFVEQSTRFLKPVFVGDSLKSEFQVDKITEKSSKDAAFVRFRVQLVNGRGETVLDGFQTYLLANRPAAI